MPIANTTSPIPSTIGMTSGFFTSRTANSRIRPNASAVSECLSASEWSMSPIVRRWTSIARRDVDAALEEEPSGAGEEAADDRVRHEPDQVAEPERPERQEDDAAEDRHDQRRGDDGEEDVGFLVVLQAGRLGDLRDVRGLGRRGRRHDREHGRRRVLHASHHAPATRPPRQDPERQRGRHQVQADAVGQTTDEQAAEHERGERDREDRLDGADDHARGERGEHPRGSSLLGQRSPPSSRSSRRGPSTARCVSVSRSDSVVASHRCSAAASAGSSVSIRSIDARLSRSTTLGVSATTSAVRGDAGVHRDLSDHDARAHRAQSHPRALLRHHLHAEPSRLQHEHVAGRLVLADQHRSLRERHALEVGAQARRHAVERVALVVRAPLGPALRQHDVLAPLEAAIQVRLEPDDPFGGDHAASFELPAHRIRGAREHELEPVRLRQVDHLDEGHHRRGVHARHLPEVHQQASRRCRLHPLVDPLEQAARRSEEHEPAHAQDLHPFAHRPQGRSFGGRPVDVAAEDVAERDLVHQFDPPVADREQDDGHASSRSPRRGGTP